MLTGLPPRPDFPAIIRSLESTGLSRTAIARQLRVSPSTVCRWLTYTREPRYTNGATLLFLAGKRTGEKPPGGKR